MNALQLKGKISSLKIQELASSAVDNTGFVAADLILAQLRKGLKSDGNEMPDYSAVSVDVYGKEPGPIKLYDTGAFYAGIKVVSDGKSIVYESSDKKGAMLEKRYSTKSGQVLGLTENSRVEYALDLQPEFIDLVKKQLK